MLPHQQPTLPSHNTSDDNSTTTTDYGPTSSTTTPEPSQGSWWGSWQQSLIDTVKEKSMQAVEMVKKDFNDFVETSVVLSDAAATKGETSKDPTEDGEGGGTSADADGVAAGVEEDEVSATLVGINMETIESATNVVKEGMFNFLHSVSELIAIPPDTDSETTTQGGASTEVLVDVDVNTYLEHPGGKFDEWVLGFDIHMHQSRMANILIQNSGVGEVYAQLVPAKMTHKVFWQRYFYHELVGKERREEEEEELKWDEEEEEEGEEKKEEGVENEKVGEEEEMREKVVRGNLDGEVKAEDHAVNEGDCMVEEEENLKNEIEEPKKDERKSDQVLEEKAKTKNETEEVEDLPEDTDLTRRRSLTPTPPSSVDDIGTPTVSGDEDDSNPDDKDNNLGGPTAAVKKHSPHSSDTSSVGSWLSIDDVIKVKRVEGEQQVTAVTRTPASDQDDVTISDQADSASLLSDVSDEEFDLDVDEADIAKMVEEIKTKKTEGGSSVVVGDDDDDDWEKWE